MDNNVDRFCGLKGHEMFCEVERSYIEDGFNLYGLRGCVSNFSDCLDLILDRIGPDDSDDSHLTQSACTLYGLIHARYVITAHGLDAMYNKVRHGRGLVYGELVLRSVLFFLLKHFNTPWRFPMPHFFSRGIFLLQYAAKEFGTCPLVQCSGQPVLPVGLKDEMGADTVKIFCPKCQQVYHTPPLRSRANVSTGVDGAAFGTTFPHLFLMTFNNLVPDPLPVESSYVPRVFGFRVHKSAQRALPSPEAPVAPTPAAAAAAITAKAEAIDKSMNNSNKNDKINNNNNTNHTANTTAADHPSNNNKNANQCDSNEDEDDKSPMQGEEAAVEPTAAAPPATITTTNNNNPGPLNNAAAGNNNNNNSGSNSNRSRGKGKRGRKDDKAAASAATTANAGSTVAPTFLMENPTKRRRRGPGNV